MDDKAKKSPNKKHCDIDELTDSKIGPDNMKNNEKKIKSKKDKGSKDKSYNNSKEDGQSSGSEEGFFGVLYILNEKRKGNIACSLHY